MFTSWSSHIDITSAIPRPIASPMSLMPPLSLKSLTSPKRFFCTSHISSVIDVQLPPEHCAE